MAGLRAAAVQGGWAIHVRHLHVVAFYLYGVRAGRVGWYCVVARAVMIACVVTRRCEIYGRVREVGEPINLDQLAASVYLRARIVRVNETVRDPSASVPAVSRRASCCLK